MKKPRLLQNDKGTVFVTTMLTLMLMLMAGEYFYKMADQGNYTVKRMQSSTQARYLAEAGMSSAFASLYSSWSTSKSWASTNLGLGSYSASVATPSGSRPLVTATGVVNSVTRATTAELTAPSPSALNYAIAGGGNASIDSGTANSPGTITGDIYGGGNVTLDGASNGPTLAVTGSVQAGGNLTSSSSATVSGSSTPNYSTSVAFPTPTMSYYQNIAQTNGYYINGNKTYTNASPIPANPTGGVIYVTGNVIIQGTQSTTACIVAGGNIDIDKSGSTYPRVTINQYSTYPAIVTQGNFTFSTTGNGGAYLTTTGLVYVGGNYTFSSGNHDSWSLTGTLIARGNVTITPQSFNNGTVTYVNQNPPGFTISNTQMSVKSYNT